MTRAMVAPASCNAVTAFIAEPPVVVTSSTMSDALAIDVRRDPRRALVPWSFAVFLDEEAGDCLAGAAARD